MAQPRFTLRQLQDLRAAYAQGALSVQYEDRRVVYRSRAEMAQILAEMESELGDQAGGSGRIGRTRIVSSKGTE